MGIEMIVLAFLATLFGLLAAFLASRLDELQHDFDSQKSWRLYWELQYQKMVKKNAKLDAALSEALAHAGEQ